MATISLDDDLRDISNRAICSLPPMEIEDTDLAGFRLHVAELSGEQREALELLGSICRSVLRQNGYVHLRGLDVLPDARGVLALGLQIGDMFADLTQQPTIVVPASPTVGVGLQGNQTEALFLHTDFAMLERPPAVTIIHCRQADPMGHDYGRSGISVAQHIVSKLFGSPLLESFFTVSLPFGGRTPSGKDIFISCPILTRVEAGSLTGVRFHPSRIHHGFRVRGTQPSPEETEVLRLFLEASKQVRFDFALEPGEYLIVNNRVSLHDRTRCSLEIGRNGIRSRITHIAFVQEITNEKLS